MRGSRKPGTAAKKFRDSVQSAVSCVCNARANLLDGDDEPWSLLLGDGTPARLRGSNLSLTLQHKFTCVPAAGERGPWKVQSLAYLYSIDDADGQEMLAYHWHPATRSTEDDPHLHLGAALGNHGLEKAHIPTGRVAIEEFLCLLVEAFDVKAPDGWADVMAKSLNEFREWSTWPAPGQPTSPG